MTATALEDYAAQFPRITGVIGFVQGDARRACVMVRNQLVGGSQYMDFIDLEEWLAANHPEVFTTTDGGKREMDPTAIPPAVLTAYFEDHARRNPPKDFLHLGHLVDASVIMKYSQPALWQPGAIVKRKGADGNETVEIVPVN